MDTTSIMHVAEIAIAVLVAFNVLLTGLYKALDYLKTKVTSTALDGADSKVHAVSDFLQKVIDTIGANPEHKDTVVASSTTTVTATTTDTKAT